MKVFHCDHCAHVVFFENTRCVVCDHLLAYLPDIGQMGSLEPRDDGLWQSSSCRSTAYRLCRFASDYNVCNWAIPSEDTNPLCPSCRLTQRIPDLAVAGFREAWCRLEAAKRRVLYTLLHLRLPMTGRSDALSNGLAFQFLADPAGPESQPLLTGHNNGIITISIAEADDAERERSRLMLHEPYRTLVGHIRHEIGHYSWDQLIKDTDHLDAFRQLFGDERLDYGHALHDYYETGAPPDWQDRFVTAYAAAHPWEDWAETWAHYLHMCDTLETAAACGIFIRPRRPDEPVLTRLPQAAGSPSARFDQLIDSWFPLTYVLNNLNRGLGLPDGYPFVLSAPALVKLRFVHDTISAAASVPHPAAATLGA